jgi:hypothetical protein
MMGGNPYAGFGGAGAAGATGAAGSSTGGQAAAADTRPLREKYANELQQIKDMGLSDEEVILQVLQQTNGNVPLALEILFNS